VFAAVLVGLLLDASNRLNRLVDSSYHESSLTRLDFGIYAFLTIFPCGVAEGSYHVDSSMIRRFDGADDR